MYRDVTICFIPGTWHSLKAASGYGDLYVGIGSDATIEGLRNRRTVYSERERLYMVKAIRYVTDAYINPGSGMLDFIETLDLVKPDVFVVNSDGGSDVKRQLCAERGIEYVELERVPDAGLDARSTTHLAAPGGEITSPIPCGSRRVRGLIGRMFRSMVRGGR